MTAGDQAGSGDSRAADAALALEAKDQGRAAERADNLAYLNRRAANCRTMMANSPEFEGEARIMLRQLEVLIGDVQAGLHEDAALVAARVASSSEAVGQTGMVSSSEAVGQTGMASSSAAEGE